MNKIDPVETWMVCRDCLDVSYNKAFGEGFLEEGVDYAAALRGWELVGEMIAVGYPGKTTHLEETEVSDEFSSRRCECCGSWLAGARYGFGLWIIG